MAGLHSSVLAFGVIVGVFFGLFELFGGLGFFCCCHCLFVYLLFCFGLFLLLVFVCFFFTYEFGHSFSFTVQWWVVADCQC